MLGLVGSYRNANERVVILTNNSGARAIDKAIGDLCSCYEPFMKYLSAEPIIFLECMGEKSMKVPYNRWQKRLRPPQT